MKRARQKIWRIVHLCAILALLAGLLGPFQTGQAAPAVSSQAVQPAPELPEAYTPWAWDIGTVTMQASAQDMGIGIDSQNQPHIIYPYNTTLYHAWLGGDIWQTQPVITDTVNNFTDLEMQIGLNDSLHVVYLDTEFLTLEYAVYEEGAWSTEAVTTTQYLGYEPALALDRSGQPWVVYARDTLGSALYAAHKQGGAWVNERITTQGACPSLTFDALDTPHVGYCARSGQASVGLRHAWYDGAAWQTGLVESGNFIDTAIATAPDGSLMLVYYDATNGDLRRAVYGGTNWQAGVLYGTGNVGACARLAFDTPGNYHVTFQDVANQRLNYLQGDGGGWMLNVVGSSNGLNQALALGADDRPRLAFYNQADVQLETAAAVLMPDLLLSGAWAEGGALWAQVQNLGERAIGLGSTLRVQVDGVDWDTETLGADLLPGERRNVPFSRAYTCSGSSDAIAAFADAGDWYDESDEGNNEWNASWNCDGAPPQITAGPAAGSLTTSSALISWTTDEPADGTLYWSQDRLHWQSGKNVALTTGHAIQAKGLSPATVYTAYVRSVDASGNAVESSRIRFRTPAAPSSAPAAPVFQFQREDRDYEAYNLQASFSNAGAIERVEFLLDGAVIGAAFASTNGSFQAGLLPARLSMPRSAFYAAHELTVRAHMPDGATYNYPFTFQPDLEYMTGEVTFTAPQDSVYYISGTSAPVGATLPLELSAAEFEWSCAWSVAGAVGGLPAIPPADCESVQSEVSRLDVYVDGVLKYSVIPAEDDLTHAYNWPVGGLPSGVYTIKADARLSDGSHKIVERQIEIRTGEVQLALSRSVFRLGNKFLVTLTVRNMPTATASAQLADIMDYVAGFQAISEEGAAYDVLASYKSYPPVNGFTPRGSQVRLVNISSDQGSLAPGESSTFAYTLIPVMVENPSQAIYQFGYTNSTFIVYSQGGITGFLASQVETNTVVDAAGEMVSVSQSVGRAFKSSDYLIVTNPARILMQPGAATHADALFSRMAQLAEARQGVLGYLYTYDDGSLLDSYLENGGAWSSRMHANFEQVGGGYVLLVGESEVIPGFESPHLDISWSGGGPNHAHYSDHPYANTYHGGDKPGKPELVLGRLVGNDLAQISKSLSNAYTNATGLSGQPFDYSGAFLVSGDGKGQDLFIDNVNELTDLLIARSVAAYKLHWKDVAYLDSFAMDFAKPDGFTAGDMDGDGSDELLIASNSTKQIHIVYLDTFSIVSVDFPWQEYDSLAAGDIDNDGLAEIIVAEEDDRLWAFAFNGAQIVPLSGFPVNVPVFAGHTLAVGERNSGHLGLEIALYNWKRGRIYVYSHTSALLDEVDLFSAGVSTGAYSTFAMGNLIGGSADEYILADYANDRILVLGASGYELATISVLGLVEGEYVAVVELGYTTLYEEVVRANTFTGDLQVYTNSNNGTLFELKNSIPAPYSVYDGLAFARDADPNTPYDQLYIADRDDKIYHQDSAYPAVGNALVVEGMRSDADIILYRGHGNVGKWVFDFPGAGSLPDFNGATPIALGFTCLSGGYEEWGLPEMFFERGAGGFIGSTEVSSHDHNPAAAEKYLNYINSGESLAKAFLDLERNRYGTMEEMWKFWVYEYNYYGDPKFGLYNDTLPLISIPASTAAPETVNSLAVSLPDYTVQPVGGYDYVDLPGGEVYLQTGEPRLPYWTLTQDYPAGVVVQGVSLLSQSGLTTSVGLNLPVTGLFHSLIPTATAELAAPGWYPQVEPPFTWEVEQNPDASSRLTIALYPFSYDTATTNARFYKNFEFDVQTAASSVQISRLLTDQQVYPLNQPVTLTLHTANSGAALDGFLEVTVQRLGSNLIVGSLPLTDLNDLGETGVFQATWDSSGAPAGQYEIVARLYAESGELLDSYAAQVTLGVSQGELTAFSAAPARFTPGQTVDFSAMFENTGDQPITGTLQIHITAGGSLTDTLALSETFASLAPGAAITLTPAWDTTAAPLGDYTASAFVQYDSCTSEIWQRELTTYYKLYAPMVVK